MESQRQQKINRLLQKDLGDILQKDMSNLGLGAMLTVTKVSVSSDLSIAKIYVSILAAQVNAEVVNNLNKHSGEIRYLLGQRIRNQLRIIPSLRFYEDDSLDYLENIERILKSE
ncbi:MAG TPA: 30S ribosome-binding factor RbfA [Bacteroidales bacterium]|jgi:ribosome-binding factor A|nr:30S ribosome-binding factor RbfA [Bacteroidales bacterium]